MNDEDHATIAQVRLPAKAITQHVAAEYLFRSGSPVISSREESVRLLVRSLDKEDRLAFAADMINCLKMVASDLLGADTINELRSSGGDHTNIEFSMPNHIGDENISNPADIISVDSSDEFSQRDSLRSWLIYLTPLVETSNSTVKGKRLHPVTVMLALEALQWDEVLPIFRPGDPDKIQFLPGNLAAKQKMLKRRRGLPKKAFAIAVVQCEAIAWTEALIQAGAKPGSLHLMIVDNFQISSWDTARKWKNSFLNIVGSEHFQTLRKDYLDLACVDLPGEITKFERSLPQLGREFVIAKGWKPADQW